jgi:hypothetical protein
MYVMVAARCVSRVLASSALRKVLKVRVRRGAPGEKVPQNLLDVKPRPKATDERKG